MRTNEKIIPYRDKAIETLQGLYKSKKINAVFSSWSLGPRYISLDVDLGNPVHVKDALAIGEMVAVGVGSPSVMARRELGVVRYAGQGSAVMDPEVARRGVGHQWQGFEINYDFACSSGEVSGRHLDLHVEGDAPV